MTTHLNVLKMKVKEFYCKAKELVSKERSSKNRHFLEDILVLKPIKETITILGNFLKDLHTNFKMSGKVLGGVSFSGSMEEKEGSIIKKLIIRNNIVIK